MTWNWLDRYRDLALLVLRVGVGLGFFWYHGWPKLSGGPERWAGTGEAMASVGLGFAPEFWGLMAGLAEGLGGLLFAAGLFFRPVTLFLAITMVVATTNHFVTGVGTPAHALKNTFFFLGLLAVGPGRYSLDHALARRRRGEDGPTRY
jgi:putative oxidoreductase